MDTLDSLEMDNRFSYHTPKNDQIDRYQKIRDKAKEFAELVMLYSPKSREQSLALTNIEQASMWANAAIARRE